MIRSGILYRHLNIVYDQFQPPTIKFSFLKTESYFMRRDEYSVLTGGRNHKFLIMDKNISTKSIVH